ncbi:MAG TPA: septum formation initiator family protein [Terriglobales bacterium]|nr:septum formation initiator family protein [Terriglobales bacterium]
MDFRVVRLSKFRNLPRPEQGLRAIVDRAPQAEAFVNHFRERLRPSWDLLYRLRRRIATGGVLVMTIWVFLHVMFGDNGMVVYRQKRSELQELQQQVRSLQQENEHYSDQIKALKSDPREIEKEAREQLHYARPGEVVYVAPPPASPNKPVTNSAKNRP